MRKVISMVLCLMLVLGLATTAFAAETIVNNTNHAYHAYQIFKGTQSEGVPSLGNVQWGSGIKGDEFLAALKLANGNYNAFSTAQGVAEYLAMDSQATPRQEDAKQFANLAVNYLTTEYTEIAANAEDVTLEPGYYLLVDVTKVDGKTDAKNSALLQVTNLGDVYISKKYTVPTSDKKILEDGTNLELTTDEKSIGDVVAFKLTGTMPSNLADYETYRYIFHDHLSEGLTFNGVETVQVKIDGIDVPAGSYTFVSEPEHKDGHQCSFEIVFEDIKGIKDINVTSSSVVTVVYTATLNEGAKLYEDANPNTMHLEFSNNPNWTGVGEDGSTEPPTGETPDKTVNVYTTGVEITKKDGKGNILTGAAFEITGEAAHVVLTTGDVYVPYVAEGEEAPDKYWRLTDGTYTTTAPDENVDTTVYEKVGDEYPEYMKKKSASLDTKAAENVKAEAFVDENGILKFEGLGVGTYKIKETVTPAGYNTIGELTLEIKWEDTNSDGNYEFTYTWSGPVTGTTSSIIVNNTQGSTLPETGGMGTTLFYIIGGLMVAASAVLLITKRRMTVE